MEGTVDIESSYSHCDEDSVPIAVVTMMLTRLLQ